MSPTGSTRWADNGVNFVRLYESRGESGGLRLIAVVHVPRETESVFYVFGLNQSCKIVDGN